VVHFALTINIESMTVIQQQYESGAFKIPAEKRAYRSDPVSPYYFQSMPTGVAFVGIKSVAIQ
jgi:hypothetical protein